jgi:hypothetical protein
MQTFPFQLSFVVEPYNTSCTVSLVNKWMTKVDTLIHDNICINIMHKTLTIHIQNIVFSHYIWFNETS